MDTAGTYRVFVFLVVVGTVYVLAAGILIRKLLGRLQGAGPPSKNAQIWYSRGVLGLAGIGILCGAYGYYVEPYWPSVTHFRIDSAKLVTLSRFDKTYESGLYRKGDTVLYVNRGIGMEGGYAPRVRFCARPEVTVIDIVSAGHGKDSN